VTSQFGDSQLGDVKSGTGVSHLGITVIIYQQTTFSDPTHLACAYTSQNLL